MPCKTVFRVIDGDSMEALHKAIALRSAHEVGEHGYHHVPHEEPTFDIAAAIRHVRRSTPAPVER